MSKKRFLIMLAVPLFFTLAASSPQSERLFSWKYTDLLKISRYTEDRVAYQLVNHFSEAYVDDSIETLTVIRDKKMYLFKDGYDDEALVRQERLLLDMRNALYEDQEMWKNKMNGAPDYVMVTDRRIELMKNMDEKFVNENFGKYYKSVRDAFLKRHVSIFRELMRNRKDSGLIVNKGPIDSPLYIGAQSETKYFTNASAKTIDEKVYYCEDADGDGITETFTVTRPDGFNWGYKSGPNIIFIFHNDPKNKEVADIIGKLAYESYFGTPEEEKTIINTLPKEQEIVDMIKDIVPDEKFYK